MFRLTVAILMMLFSSLAYGYDPAVDSLTSTDATAPLSAKQGKVLQDGKLGSAAAKVCVNRTGTVIRTAWKYTDTHNMWLDFDSATVGGYNPNGLTTFSKWWTKPHSGPVSGDDLSTGATLLDTSVTDWANGPYNVQASARPNAASYNSNFTGGNHLNAYNSTSTARQLSTTVEVDGLALTSGAACGFRVDITTVNNVQADNTMISAANSDNSSAEILQETVHYSITGDGNVNTDTTVRALEGAYIRLVYGVMGSRRSGIWDGTLYWNNAASLAPVTYTSGLVTTSGAKSAYPNVWRYNIRGTSHDLAGWIDTTYGLGAGANVATTSARSFSTSANKVYFYMVSGSANTLTLATNATASWRGGYRFTPHIGGTEDAIPASALSASYYLPTIADQTSWNAKESAISVGTTAQFIKGDKSLGTLNQAAVAGLTTSDTPTFKNVGTVSTTQYVQGPTIQYSYADDAGAAIYYKKSGRSGGTNTSSLLSGVEVGKFSWDGYDGTAYGSGAKMRAITKEALTSSSRGMSLVWELVPYGISSIVHQTAVSIERNSALNTILSLGDLSGGTATLQSTSHGTKGLLTIPNAVDVTSTITAKQFTETAYAPTGTTITVSLANGTIQRITTTAATTVNFPTLTAGQSLTLNVCQGATPYAVTFGGTTPTWRNGAAYVVDQVANGCSKIVLDNDGVETMAAGDGPF